MLETTNHVFEKCEYENFYSKQNININAKVPVRYSYGSFARANESGKINLQHCNRKLAKGLKLQFCP